jgi:hypothetical protein
MMDNIADFQLGLIATTNALKECTGIKNRLEPI